MSPPVLIPGPTTLVLTLEARALYKGMEAPDLGTWEGREESLVPGLGLPAGADPVVSRS